MQHVEPHLDPQDWPHTRTVGHAMLDDIMNRLEGACEGPAWRPMPREVVHSFKEPLPRKGEPLEAVHEAFKARVMPYPTGNLHPRFFGWVVGNGTVTGMLADMLAAGLNPHMAGFNQAPPHVERQVLRWFAELLGFPLESSGVLTAGGSAANLNGLAVARQIKAGFDVGEAGLHEGPRLTVYGSNQTHSWVQKACALMGLGRTGFRQVRVDQHYRLDIKACRDLIEKDLAEGYRPFCVIGSAGTTNTGSIDDLPALRKLADDYNLWFHVDGALGSLAALTPNYSHLVQGQELADSLAFDLHKWGYLPFGVACILVRDATAHKATFAERPAYLVSSRRGVAVDTTYFADRGLELSRGFRALKVWMALKHQGVDLLGQVIEKNIRQTMLLSALVQAADDLELLAPAALNVVCFRYNPGGLDTQSLDKLNQEIVIKVQERGLAVTSQTVLKEKFAIRVCIANHRTRDRDLHELVDGIRSIGRELTQHEPRIN